MKTIRGLNQKLVPIDDQPSQELIDGLPTLGNIMRMMICNSMAKDGEEAIEIYNIGNKIKKDTDILELEDAQFKIVKDKVFANKCNPAVFAAFHAQVLLKVREAEGK